MSEIIPDLSPRCDVQLAILNELGRMALSSTDLPHDPRAISAKTADGRWTQSEVAVPILSKDRLPGGLVVESCDPSYFKPEHVQVLETLASQIAVSIDNAQLFRQVLAKEQKLEHVLAEKSGSSARETLRALMAEIRKFSRGAEQHDDITAFILEVRGGP